MNIIISFMYIFGFKIISIVDSTILVGIMLTTYMCINKKFANLFFKKLKNKNTQLLILTFLLIVSWGLICTEINMSQDLSYIKVLIHLIIVILIGYEVIAFYEFKGIKDKIANYIIICFIIQSILQWIFFIFPSISSYFNVFRTQGMIDKSQYYYGYRGIAITSSGFFSLSSSYALVTVLYFTKYNTLFKNNIAKYLFFAIMFSGTFFAGRTGFIGLAFVILLCLIRKNNNKIKIPSFKKVIAISTIFFVFVSFIAVTINNDKFARLYSFAFELINNYKSGNGFYATSTNTLMKMYDVDIYGKTLLIGDGIYTVSSNSGGTGYYQNTDIGYFRKILYFGIIGLLLSVILQYYIIGRIKGRKEIIVIILLLMVLELKGEIIGINIMVNSILVLYSSLYDEKEEMSVKGSNYLNDYVQ